MPTSTLLHKPFDVRQLAYLPVEGAGFNGLFRLKGAVTLRRGSTIHVSVKGATSITNLATQNNASVDFFATVYVKRDGVVVKKKIVRRSDGPSAWPMGDVIIGSAVIALPGFSGCRRYAVLIEGGYVYSENGSSVVPSPPTTEAELELISCRV